MAALLDGVSTPLVVLLLACLIIGSITYRIMYIRWLLKNNAGAYGMYDPLMYPMAMMYGDNRSQQQTRSSGTIAGGSSEFFESASLPKERLF